MKKRKTAKLTWESKYRRLGFDLVIGVDEAGRGPLAGPVSAAAVALLVVGAPDSETGRLFRMIRDSKKMSASQRAEAYKALVGGKNIVWGNAMVSEKIIDKINILEATKLAMAKAVACLMKKLGSRKDRLRAHCLLDGNFSIDIGYPQRSIVAGDAKVFSISAASVIAKFTRDRYMEMLDKKFPGYGFSENKGYPTAAHRDALKRLGPCAAHRKTFSPVAKEL